MSTTDENDADGASDRRPVQTYVPTHQYERWAAEAEAMGMSVSEYVRTMVQAGRTDLDPPSLADTVGEGSATDDSASDPRGEAIEERVAAVLEDDEYVGWDEIRAELTDDLDERLESALETLQASGRVRHSGRHGGYTLS